MVSTIEAISLASRLMGLTLEEPGAMVGAGGVVFSLTVLASEAWAVMRGSHCTMLAKQLKCS